VERGEVRIGGEEQGVGEFGGEGGRDRIRRGMRRRYEWNSYRVRRSRFDNPRNPGL